MKVVVLPKKTADNMVTATIELRFGDADDAGGQERARRSSPAALLMAGTKSKTRQQLQEEMRKLNAQIKVSGGGGGGSADAAAAGAAASAAAADFQRHAPPSPRRPRISSRRCGWRSRC